MTTSNAESTFNKFNRRIERGDSGVPTPRQQFISAFKHETAIPSKY